MAGWTNGTALTDDAHTLTFDFLDSSLVEKRIGIERWNDLDTDGYASSDLTEVAFPFLGNTIYARLEDNNTNRIFSISPNGIDWHQMLSISRTTHITPTHFLVGCYGTTGSNIKGTLFHTVEDDQ